MKTIQPVCHEFTAEYLFNKGGLNPWFGALSRIQAGDGSQVAEFTADGERWICKLYVQDSNIVHPGTTPDGTTIEFKEIREPRIQVTRHPEEDPVGEQKFNAHMRPRWKRIKAQTKSGQEKDISLPNSFGEGISVRVAGANIDFHRYITLLRRGASALGIRADYFSHDEPGHPAHPYSSTRDGERYIRAHTDASGPLHARDGPIASMAHLLENDREGVRELKQRDDDYHGRNLPGFYHTVHLDPRRVREAFPGHELPIEVKHYYAREALSVPEESPLRHPKLGASYQVSKWDGKLGVTDEDLTQLKRELDRVVKSCLLAAGLELAPEHDTGPYIDSDAYFPIEIGEQGPDPVELNITRIRSSQESVVIKHLADGLSPVQWESLSTLVTDGGNVSPEDIADEHGRHTNSVRRALRAMDDLVVREYASVSLQSEYVAELVHNAVEEARNATRRATEATAKAMEAAERGLSETMSAFVAWSASHGVDVSGVHDARMELRFGPDQDLAEVRHALRRGYRLWMDAGMSEEAFRQARVFVGGSRGVAWRWLQAGTTG